MELSKRSFHPLLILLLLIPGACLAETDDFQGVIGRTEAESTPHWPTRPTPPKGAPNILIWLMDDVGFGHAGSFGGLIETRNLDKLANQGLRFTNFHATPLCSPTRASLLSGRNPHAVGMGAHAKTASGYPGYNARIPKSAAGIGRILKDQGYATYAIGKWDQLPSEHTSPLGPFDYWPSGQGFEHFYGFLTFDANHFDPLLWQDHSPVFKDKTRASDYHLTADLADRAIEQITNQFSIRPNQPFLMYWSTGAVHAPHHAPQSYLDKYKGKFDQGWHAVRKEILARQKHLGLVPQDAQLPPWSEDIPKWDDLNEDQKRMAARQMEAFAAMLEHTDDEFGRIINALEESRQLENTIIVVVSDNGASAEGGIPGTYNEITMGQVTWEDNLKHYDNWGGPETFPHYSVGWAAAGNTPFKYFKQSAYEGGNRVPMLISWGRSIPKGGIRPQFHHVNDIVPTLLDLAGIEAPEHVGGVAQKPMDGISFRYALENANSPSQKKVQYFELWGNRGIWSDGWKANLQARPRPWDIYSKPASEPWELYNVNEDFNELNNLAESHPEKLAELKTLFHQQALKNQVYPLFPDHQSASKKRLMKSLQDRDYQFNYTPETIRVPDVMAPPIFTMPFELIAKLNNESGQKTAVIFSQGGHDGGFALYLEKGKPVFAYNHMGMETHYIKSRKSLPLNTTEVTVKMARQKASGTVTLMIDNKQVAKEKVEDIFPTGPQHETFDVGIDLGSPVVKDYQPRVPAPKGFIHQLNIQVIAPQEAH